MAESVEVMMKIYLIKNRPAPWGDWGDVLVYGFTRWDEKTNTTSVLRTGPITPSAYLSSGNLVLTAPIKEALEASGLRGIPSYTLLEKKRIVDINYDEWDPETPLFQYLNISGEPESLILRRKHNPKLSDCMPSFWKAEVTTFIALEIDRDREALSPSEYLSWLRIESKIDVYEGGEYLGLFISEKAKLWFEQHCPDCFEYFLISPKA